MNNAFGAAFYVLVCSLTLAGLWREWRVQYIVTIIAIMYAIAAAAIWLGHELTLLAPLMLTILVLSSRGVSRLMLGRAQEHPYYGWFVIGLASVMAAGLQSIFLAPYNVHLPFVVYLLLSTLMQVATVPWLIKRKPGSSPSYWPVATLGFILITWCFAFLVVAYQFRGYTPF